MNAFSLQPQFFSSLSTKLTRIAVTCFALSVLPSTISANSAQAATVGVFGNSCAGCGFNLNTIDNFYNSGLTVNGQAVSSNILGGLNSTNLANINLLWLVQPSNNYTSAEIGSLGIFLSNGGRIAFLGEHGTLAPNENNRINTAISSLGGNISINNILVDGRFLNATVQNGQILSNPLTQGVNTYNYAAFAPLNISGSAIALMKGQDDPSTVMMAYQNIGAGSIFTITDQNVWTNVNLASNDNKVLFQNLLSASTVPTAVPEPFTILGTLLGSAAAFKMRKRLKVNNKL